MNQSTLGVGAAMTAGPISTGERLDSIDILRGFALLGILLVNFPGDSDQLFPAANAATEIVMDVLVHDSFYPLFSFLFGLGFAVQMERARARGKDTTLLFMRRLAVLFLIGAIHAVVIWQGDILAGYALFGVWLIPISRLPTRGVLATLVVLLLLQVASDRITGAMEARAARDEDTQTRALAQGVRTQEERIQSADRIYAEGGTGSFAASISWRWTLFARLVARTFEGLTFLLSDLLLFIVAGFYAGRRRLLQDAAKFRSALIVLTAVGLAASILGHTFAWSRSDWGSEMNTLAFLGENVGLTAFYIGGISLLVSRGAGFRRNLGVFLPVGRMALTNYLGQSVIASVLFFSYGLDLPDPGAALKLLVNLGIFFLIQVPFSKWWLSRFQFGPAEWVWRSVAYGARQPMLRPHWAESPG